MARRPAPAGGAPDWLVTFADLMSLLVCFFVLLISFSVQDKQKLQIVAGSMREAFGVQLETKRSGIIERDGSPERQYLRNLNNEESVDDLQSVHSSPRPSDSEPIESAEQDFPGTQSAMASAAVALRQALQANPELAELSNQIIFEDRPEGMAIEIVDQDGRSMFGAGSIDPNSRTLVLLETLGREIRALPNKITITGHTARGETGDVVAEDAAWDLSSGRAATVRRLLSAAGVTGERFDEVVGRADREPYFKDDPALPANRRITILLHHTAPPLPLSHTP